MPPRRRTTQAAEPAAAALSLNDLPDELLLRVLERLPMADRLSSAAPVSRRLRTLCLAPQLLHTIQFETYGEDEEQLLERLESLLRCLQHHAAHVRSLDLNAFYALGGKCERAVGACLAMCGAMPQLASLTLHPGYEWDWMGWLCGATALTSLRMADAGVESEAQLAPFSRLTALRELHLSGTLLCPGPATKPCLPPSLEALCIEGDLNVERDLPPQLLLGLTNLQRLTLVDSDYTSASLAAIAALTALTRLHLVTTEYFPAPSSLSTLSNLRQLGVASAVKSMAPVEGMLAALPGLTSVALHLGFPHIGDDEPPVLRLPPSVTAMRGLRRLSFSTYREGAVDIGLPGGAWLAQLHWLGLPWHMALAAVSTLATATQLQHLCLFALPPYELNRVLGVKDEEWAAFWRTLQAHAPLQTLYYELQSDQDLQLCRPFVIGLLQLSRRRPELRIARTEHCGCVSTPGSSPFCDAMLGDAAEPAG